MMPTKDFTENVHEDYTCKILDFQYLMPNVIASHAGQWRPLEDRNSSAYNQTIGQVVSERSAVTFHILESKYLKMVIFLSVKVNAFFIIIILIETKLNEVMIPVRSISLPQVKYPVGSWVVKQLRTPNLSAISLNTYLLLTITDSLTTVFGKVR